MSSYQLLVLDLDGTLLNSKKQISPRTKSALLQLQQQGYSIVLASGRPIPGVRPIAEELQLSTYGGFILSYNGASITNCKTGEVIFHQCLPMEAIPEIYALSKQHNVHLLSYEGDAVLTETGDDPYVEIESRINGIPVLEVPSFVDRIKTPVIKCIMLGDGDYLATVEPKVKEALGQRYSVTRSEPFFLEIMPQNVDKAYALSQLAAHLGLTREQIVACGDGFNDRSMVEYAGLGVAMANAQPSVKEVADYITLSNDEDGVAQVVETFFLKSGAK
jgi:Cof subfamily protein (haloacid dehalogenase superfamily)